MTPFIQKLPNRARAFIAKGLLAATVFATPALAERIEWSANDGHWQDPANWPSSVVPSRSASVSFGVTEESPASEINIILSGSTPVTGFRVGFGKTINISMSDGSIFGRSDAADRSDVGTDEGGAIGTGSGASHLIFKGPTSGTATVYLRSTYIGGLDSADGNSLEFTGNISLFATPTSVGSVIGRYSNNNILKFQDGVQANLVGATYLGFDTSSTGNQLIIDRSTLTIKDQTSGAGAAARLLVGAGNGRKSNSVLVEGAGAVLAVQNTLSATNTVQLGVTTNLTSGGNSLTVRNGGTVKSAGVTAIAGYDNSDPAVGANRLVIGPNGTYLSGDNISNSGLIQLAQSGILRGEKIDGAAAKISVVVAKDGRFEVAGAGLHSSVSTIIQNGATLAVGLRGDTSASVFTQSSEVTLAGGSALELAIYGSNQFNSIDFKDGARLTIQTGAVLRLTSQGHDFSAGESYQLFTGVSAGQIVGEFSTSVLPTLSNGLTWDLSRFNNEGQWTLAVIPEPKGAALGFIGFGLIALGYLGRKL